MADLTTFVDAILPYSIYLVGILLFLGCFAAVRAHMVSGTTAGTFGLGILFILGGVWLVVAGIIEWALFLFLVGLILILLDAWHEKRVARRAHAYMRG